MCASIIFSLESLMYKQIIEMRGRPSGGVEVKSLRNALVNLLPLIFVEELII